MVLAMVAGACDRGPSDAELERLRTEVTSANAAALVAAAARAGSAADNLGRTLTISGQLGAPGATLAWPELERLATTTITTMDVQQPARTTPIVFRGVAVRDLLDRFHASPGATEVTAVSIDGFRATFAAADARAHPVLLAIEADGAPIPQARGGPIYLVYPDDLHSAYIDRFWAFYVTDLVVGTEPAHLDVAGHALDAAALAALPTRARDGNVGFHVEWPAGDVHLRGVDLAAAIAAAGVALPPHGHVVVHGKAFANDDPKSPVSIAVDDLAACRPLLAMQTGADDHPITARFGGPIALALEPCGARYASSRYWVTFVQRIEVAP
jgi:hypothetical protein